MSALLSRLQEALGSAYQLDQELPSGGMSRLFLGRDSALGRRVVVKLLPPESTSEVSATRFRREMELTARLQHPHILPILTAGSSGDLLYYVMPYVEGESLRRRLDREPQLTIEEARRILSEVADALAFAHARGVVHRDVKPDNVLLEAGHAVLADFGVARALEASTSGAGLTATGMSVGTPGYMAPEQVVGDAAVDARADVYALGVLGWELIAGHAPFAGPNQQAVLSAHLTAPPPDLTSVRPDVPADLATALQRALAKMPDERFPDASAFRDAVTIAAPAPAPRKPSRTFVRGAIGVVAALLVAISVLNRRSADPPLNPNLLAVAPFNVYGGELELWREGLIDLLSRLLDGQGPLRTVAPTAVIRRWTPGERTDEESSRALGHRTGAGLVLFGSVTQSGATDVRVQADLVDVTTGERVATVDLREAIDHMDRLADSTAVGLLRDLSGTRTLGATRQMSIGTSSLRALRAFLAGEQHYRRSEMDSAQAEYERAAAIDTSFGLAFHRLGIVNGWLRGATDSSSLVHRIRAGALVSGLVPRDSLLLVGDSAFGAALLVGSDTATRRLGRRAIAVLTEAARRYPDDPQVWYVLGDAKLHLRSAVRVTAPEMLDDFERAIALDSLFAPAYIHAVELAVVERDTALAHQLADKFLALSRHGSESEHLDALSQWLRAGTTRLDTAGMTGNAAHLLAQALAFYPDSIESGVLVSRSFLQHRQSIGENEAHARHHLASALATRGRLREAVSIGATTPAFVAEFSLLDAYPADSIGRVLADWAATDAELALGWWGLRADSTAMRKHLTWIGATQRRRPNDASLVESLRVTQLLLATAIGDVASATRLADEYADSTCLRACDGVNLVIGRFFARIGDGERATRWLSPPHYTVIPPLTTVFALERGRLAERRGLRDTAMREFRYVTEMWRHADPEVAPLLAEARNAVARLARR